jgi:hypothetical protein
MSLSREPGRCSKSLALAMFLFAPGLSLFCSPGQRCASCHPSEVAGYDATQMADALSPPGPVPAGSFTHRKSGTQFSVTVKGSNWVMTIERDGYSAEYVPAYAIGSGAHAIAYIIEIGNHLYQAPLCYYPRSGWGMAPGYENYKAPDFYRPVTPECLICHSGQALPIKQTLNTYQNPPFRSEAITCARCHGPVEAHLRDPVPGSIVNPARLPPRARDSVCEQCHLAGEARISNPGERLSEFHPGEDLEDVYSVYVFQGSRDPSRPSPLDVISQVQQLALSHCARASGGKLWCGTCHNPHQTPVHPEAYYRARCLSCHGAALLKTHPKPNMNCIDCHMPRLPVEHGGHTIFTDHRIAIYTPQELAAKQPLKLSAAEEASTPLVTWHSSPAPYAERNLGLADIEVGEKLKSIALVSQGLRLLLANRGEFPNDPAVLTSIGEVMLGAGDKRDAAQVLDRVIKVQPNNAMAYLHAAGARKALGENPIAIQELQKALELDPLLLQPYRDLASIYRQEGNSAELHLTYERFLKHFPKCIEAQEGNSITSPIRIRPIGSPDF